MNKIMILMLVALVILSAGAIAETKGQEEMEPKGAADDTAMNASPTMKEMPHGMDDNVTMDDEENETEHGNAAAAEKKVEAIKESLQERERAMEQDMEGMGEDEQQMVRNRNEVRVAVQALHELGNMTGGIGKNISAIAKEFNNSAQATYQAEERIQEKSGFARFFTGGDEKAAKALEQETSQNQDRIQQLQQLKDECDCDQAVKDMIKEQVQSLEQEQARLQDLAAKESKKKGLLGWIWK